LSRGLAREPRRSNPVARRAALEGVRACPVAAPNLRGEDPEGTRGERSRGGKPFSGFPAALHGSRNTGRGSRRSLPEARFPKPRLNSINRCEIISQMSLTAQQAERAFALIANPPPGSKLAAAKEFGIDLTLLLANLALTPTERLQKAFAVAAFHEELRQAGQRHRMK